MYDLNLTVPNLTAEKYTVDNRFYLLKNYLYELNETLTLVLGENSTEILNLCKTIGSDAKKETTQNVLQLKAQSVSKFSKLKEEIIRTADSIEKSYKSEITRSQAEVLSQVERNCVSKSELGEYEAEVNAKLLQTAEEIELVAENSESVKTDLENFKTSARSEISVSADAIISKVEDLYQTKDESSELETRISGVITQTERNITENFSREVTSLSEDISTVGGNVNNLISDLDVYIRRGELSEGVYGIEIGRTDSNIKARFTNDRLSFYQGISEVAYVSGSSLYITNADILDYLRIGNSTEGYFLFDTTSNGLEVRWIDAE